MTAAVAYQSENSGGMRINADGGLPIRSAPVSTLKAGLIECQDAGRTMPMSAAWAAFFLNFHWACVVERMGFGETAISCAAGPAVICAGRSFSRECVADSRYLREGMDLSAGPAVRMGRDFCIDVLLLSRRSGKDGGFFFA